MIRSAKWSLLKRLSVQRCTLLRPSVFVTLPATIVAPLHTSRLLKSEKNTPSTTTTQEDALTAEEKEFVDGRLFIRFDCKVCSTTNSKFMSKHAYTKGVVIIRCDGCQNLHLMADHLGWFDSQSPPGTIEDILKRSGKESEIKRLTVNEKMVEELPKELLDGLMEFSGKKLETSSNESQRQCGHD